MLDITPAAEATWKIVATAAHEATKVSMDTITTQAAQAAEIAWKNAVIAAHEAKKASEAATKAYKAIQPPGFDAPLENVKAKVEAGKIHRAAERAAEIAQDDETAKAAAAKASWLAAQTDGAVFRIATAVADVVKNLILAAHKANVEAAEMDRGTPRDA